jgi:hypothetical protein
MFGKTKDLTPLLIKYGLTQSSVNKVILEGADAAKTWRNATSSAAGDTYKALTETYVIEKFLTSQTLDLVKAKKEEFDYWLFTGNAQKAYAAGAVAFRGNFALGPIFEAMNLSLERTGASTANVASGLNLVDMQALASAAALLSARDAMNALHDAFRKQLNVQFAFDDQQITTSKAFADYQKAEDAATRTHGKNAAAVAAQGDAYRVARKHAADLASAIYDLAYQNSHLKDESERQAQATLAQAKEFRDLAAGLGPNDPLRSQLEAYAQELENKIPKEIRTKLILDTTGVPPGIWASATQDQAPWAMPNIPATTSSTSSGRRAPASTTIIVQGAVDPSGTARQIRDLVNTDAARRSTGSTLS